MKRGKEEKKNTVCSRQILTCDKGHQTLCNSVPGNDKINQWSLN